MSKNRSFWIAIVTNKGANVLEGTVVPPGRPHLEVRARLEHVEEERQHGRPSPRRSKDGHSYANWGNEDEENLTRHARRVAGWLHQRGEELSVDRLKVFASPRLAGALRTQYPPKFAEHVLEENVDLGYMQAKDLVKHPAIAVLFEGLA